MQTISKFSSAVIQKLNLNIPAETPIYLGQSNIDHMITKHPDDYSAYSAYMSQILDSPDFVGINPSDNSIEFVKEIKLTTGEYVKVAVRISNSGKYFARSLYKLNPNRVNNFIKKGKLIKLNS